VTSVKNIKYTDLHFFMHPTVINGKGEKREKSNMNGNTTVKKKGNDQPLSQWTENVRLKREYSENYSKYFIKIFFSPEINYRFKVLYEVSQK